MLIRKVLRRVLTMGSLPWRTLMLSLQAGCLLLCAALVFLLCFQESGNTDHLHLAKSMQDLAQLALLGGVLIPVCLEDMLPPDREDPNNSCH